MVITLQRRFLRERDFDPESRRPEPWGNGLQRRQWYDRLTKDNKFIWKDEKVNDGEELSCVGPVA